MEKGGDAVKHVNEYQSLNPAVNNDSTAALCLLPKPRRSLGESCQGNSELNKYTVSCQKVEGKDKRLGLYKAKIQIYNISVPHTCTHRE